MVITDTIGEGDEDILLLKELPENVDVGDLQSMVLMTQEEQLKEPEIPLHIIENDRKSGRRGTRTWWDVDPSEWTTQTYEKVKMGEAVIDKRFVIVLDAQNIAMHHGNNNFFSAEGILLAYQYYTNLGCKVIGCIPMHCFDDRKNSSFFCRYKVSSYI